MNMVEAGSQNDRSGVGEQDRSNPYRAPQASNEQVSAVPVPDRRFRFRVIPATLLWVFSPLILIGCLVLLGALAYFVVMNRWIAPDPETLTDVQAELTNPPVIAYFLSVLSAGVCGVFGAMAWMRGKWWRAIILSAAFVLLLVFAAYVTGELD